MNKPSFKFKWQSNNHFELLPDSSNFIPPMLQAIDNATESIFLEMYLIASGKLTSSFLTAMANAVTRGVKVFMILDDFGARDLNQQDRDYITENSFNVVFYNPEIKYKKKLFLFRDHRKLLLIDGEIAFVGGFGLTDDFYPQQSNLGWRDNMLKIEGDNVTQWHRLFSQNWNRWSNIKLPQEKPASSRGNQKGRLSITAGPGKMEIKRNFIQRARNAKTRLWFCTPYFAPTRKLIKILKKLSNSGVEVRILCPGPLIDHAMVRYLAQSHYHKLLQSKVRIFEYQHRFLHAKVVLCDNWVSIGSCNLDRWNFLWNLDANQEVEDSNFSVSVEQMLLKDFSNSKEILLQQWAQISLFKRALIWFYARFFRVVDMVLSRLHILKYWKTILKHSRHQ